MRPFAEDLEALHMAVELAYRSGEITLAGRLNGLALRVEREIRPVFACHVDESAGLLELLSDPHSRRVPHAS